MRGDAGATVVTNARAYYSTRAAAGASGTRHSPRPHEGGSNRQTSDASCRENANAHPAVIPAQAGIQYSVPLVMEAITRVLLGPRLRGDDRRRSLRLLRQTRVRPAEIRCGGVLADFDDAAADGAG